MIHYRIMFNNLDLIVVAVIMKNMIIANMWKKNKKKILLKTIKRNYLLFIDSTKSNYDII